MDRRLVLGSFVAGAVAFGLPGLARAQAPAPLNPPVQVTVGYQKVAISRPSP